MQKEKTKISFNQEWAQRTSKADFVDHFKDVYTDHTPEELGAKWDELQPKEVTEKKAEEKKK